MNGLPVALLVLWSLCFAGWAVVLVRLRAELRGPARGPALFAHIATPAGIVFGSALVGFGALYSTLALTAEWWALLLVTGFRPERLLCTGGLGRLAAWAAVTAAATVAAARLVFHV